MPASSATRWTEKEEDLLRGLAGSVGLSTISKRLQRSEKAVRVKAGELKISLRFQKTAWTDAELEQLKVLRGEQQRSWEDISAIMDRSNAACRKKWQRYEGHLSERKALRFHKKLQDFMEKNKIPAKYQVKLLKFAAENYP
tara:strand:- start:1150 stop:1572 length:423 start_codon:yes stop_codon:yes gene_type:complete